MTSYLYKIVNSANFYFSYFENREIWRSFYIGMGAIRGDGTKVWCRCPNIINSKEYQTVLDRSLMLL